MRYFLRTAAAAIVSVAVRTIIKNYQEKNAKDSSQDDGASA